MKIPYFLLLLILTSTLAVNPEGNMTIIFSADQDGAVPGSNWTIKTINVTNLNITSDVNWLNFEYNGIYTIDASVLADRKDYGLEIVCFTENISQPAVDFYEYCDDNISSVDNTTIATLGECEILFISKFNETLSDCSLNIHKFSSASSGNSWLYIYSMNITINYTFVPDIPSPGESPPAYPSPPSLSENLGVGAIIGIVFACILLVAMIIVFILIWKRYGIKCSRPAPQAYARE